MPRVLEKFEVQLGIMLHATNYHFITEYASLLHCNTSVLTWGSNRYYFMLKQSCIKS